MRYIRRIELNKVRYIEVDMLKALCIVCMIFNHVYEELAADPGGPYVFFDLSSTFLGAASFMLCMGIGMRLARHQEPEEYAVRGFELLTVGQLLNIMRSALPALIGYAMTGRSYFLSNVMLVFQADILTFAGLAFLLVALLKKAHVSDRWMVVIALAMNILNYVLYLTVEPPSNFLVSQFLGFFIVTDAESFFSLSAYFVFVAIGYWIGGIYPDIKDRKAAAYKVLMVGLPVIAIYYAIRINVAIPFYPEFNSDEQYILNQGTDALANTMVAIAVMAVFCLVSDRLGERAKAVTEHLSRNINQYYCVSYMLIMPLLTIMLAIREEYMPGWVIPTLYAVFVLIATNGIIVLNDRYVHFHVVTLKGRMRRVVFALIWVVSVIVVIYTYPRITEYATVWNGYLLP